MTLPTQLLNDEVAGIWTIIFCAAFALYKLYFRVRKDNREDVSGHDTQTGYSRLLDELQEDSKRKDEIIERLGSRCDELGTRLDEQIEKRYEAERLNAKCRLRILILENRIKLLGGAIEEE